MLGSREARIEEASWANSCDDNTEDEVFEQADVCAACCDGKRAVANLLRNAEEETWRKGTSERTAFMPRASTLRVTLSAITVGRAVTECGRYKGEVGDWLRRVSKSRKLDTTRER